MPPSTHAHTRIMFDTCDGTPTLQVALDVHLGPEPVSDEQLETIILRHGEQLAWELARRFHHYADRARRGEFHSLVR